MAAVLAADVAGYSRLMGLDEEGTLARLKAIRKALVDPTIAKHRGRIVKTTGDGMLVEFASAVDAARSAVEVQRNMAGQNDGVPQDTRIEFRIEVALCDESERSCRKILESQRTAIAVVVARGLLRLTIWRRWW